MIVITEKLQPISFTTGLRNASASKITQFNQTLLMKNSKLQINCNANTKPGEDHLPSRGLDSWRLNNNLKELSQTRQLGFHKINNGIDHPRNKSNSPYIIHKARTQDINSLHKIYGIKPARDPFKDVFSSISKNGTIDQRSARACFKDQSQYVSTLEKFIKKRDKTISEKLSQGIRKNLKIDIHKNFDTLPTALLDAHQPNPEVAHAQTFRKHKFDFSTAVLKQKQKMTSIIHNNEESVISDDEFTQMENQSAYKSERKTVPQKLVSFDIRKKVYHKTIESINRTFLNQTEGYISHTYRNKVAQQSQIEVFVESINPPDPTGSMKKSSCQKQCEWQYDFQYQQSPKKIIYQHSIKE